MFRPYGYQHARRHNSIQIKAEWYREK